MLFCIESFHQKELTQILDLLKMKFLEIDLNIRFLDFPSTGPFGHQIRVVESGRYSLSSIPDHMLRMVDRMDAFLNPMNGLNQSLDELDCLILSESQFKEALETDDQEIRKWIIDINNNIPPINAIYWLLEENETDPVAEGFPHLKTIRINKSNLTETADNLTMMIAAEVKHG